MTLSKRLAQLERRTLSRSFRAAMIMDDLIAGQNVVEDKTILGLREISWGKPVSKIWMRKKGESLSRLRERVGHDMGCLEGELCLLDAVRANDE